MIIRLAVFASGGGSNLQAMIDRFTGSADVNVALVVSDRADAVALQRARDAGIRAAHVASRDRDPDDVAIDILQLLSSENIDLVALAGYLRLVPASIVEQYRGRIVNIHPALLPSFGGPGMYGRRVHEAVIAAGCRVSGASVHHVDEHYDRGSIIAQWPVPVHREDTPEDLAARVLRVEHRLYPTVIEMLARQLTGSPEQRSAPQDAFASTTQLPTHEDLMRMLWI